MNIDLLTLKLFVVVVEEQSVAKAAEREHIAASAVSKRIADLEKAAKVQLFRRHRTGLQPTPAGHAFLHHARVLMRDLAQMDSEVGEHAQGMRGSLRVVANNSAMVQYLPGDISRFLALHPLIPDLLAYSAREMSGFRELAVGGSGGSGLARGPGKAVGRRGQSAVADGWRSAAGGESPGRWWRSP